MENPPKPERASKNQQNPKKKSWISHTKRFFMELIFSPRSFPILFSIQRLH